MEQEYGYWCRFSHIGRVFGHYGGDPWPGGDSISSPHDFVPATWFTDGIFTDSDDLWTTIGDPNGPFIISIHGDPTKGPYYNEENPNVWQPPLLLRKPIQHFLTDEPPSLAQQKRIQRHRGIVLFVACYTDNAATDKAYQKIADMLGIPIGISSPPVRYNDHNIWGPPFIGPPAKIWYPGQPGGVNVPLPGPIEIPSLFDLMPTPREGPPYF